MKLEYCAWLRDNMGCDSEHVDLPIEVKNVGMLLDWLLTRDERFKGALEFIDIVIISVNLHYADRGYPVCNDDEVILCPPIAGG